MQGLETKLEYPRYLSNNVNKLRRSHRPVALIEKKPLPGLYRENRGAFYFHLI